VVVTAWTVRETVVVFVRLPDTPVMVTVAVPGVAVLLVVSVNVLALVVLVGLKDAVTPLVRPVADKLTLPLKPFCGATLIVLVPLAPCAIVKLVGDAESVKLATGTAVKVRERVVTLVRLPEVPVMVTVKVPGVAVLLAVSVNVLALVVPVGLRAAVTPLGRPVADKLTLPLKPFWGATPIVLVPLAPCAIVKLFGDAEIEKFGGGATGALMETLSKVAVARAVMLPPVAAKPTYTF
jgi:hypothetical protein